MAKKKTHEQFIQEMKIQHPNIEVLGVYKNAKTKIECKCKVCGNIFWNDPNHMLAQNCECPKCRYKKLSKKFTKGHEKFEKEYRQKFPDRNYIIFLTEYKSKEEKILCYSFIDNDYWWMRPKELNKGQENPYTKFERTGKALRKSHEQFLIDVYNNNQKVEILGTYKNQNTPILCRCKIHNTLWLANPSSILAGCGCPKCAGEIRTHEDYINKCNELNFDVLEKYKGNYSPILHRCKICGTEFIAMPCNIKSRHTGCPHCNKSKSKAEWAIADILDSNDINFNPEYTVNINDHLLRYDFWLPDYNCFIEYDGKQHFESIEHWGGESQLEQRQLYDKWKDEYCEQNNINLLRIKYTTPMEEFENIIFNFIKEAV